MTTFLIVSKKNLKQIAKDYGYETDNDLFKAIYEFKKANGYYRYQEPHWTDKAVKVLYWLLMPLHWASLLRFWLFIKIGTVIRYFDPRLKDKKE